ncbi:hypothetical protein NLU13_6269 [Sarocladium strictum]|uniref:Uncharacterized protein n=1 Tax=Sarocladium strictum TaxID=5046 RepID=A0AA39L6Z3_SARSR|nr:hypothetical protein NLU13_6269 [Sarocladium strictum]
MASSGIIRLPNASDSNTLHCCCGRSDCALLKRNSTILETVEKDVHIAAQLGQALLARHEAYMVDAERDRLDLTTRIERLEHDKQELEAENAIKIEENRSLLDQLEALNNTVADSDTKIKSLEASLLYSQQAVRRLESAAARAADAERHLAILEEEQLKLRGELITTQEDARSHAQRCKEAQRGILNMQDQLERMEKEARLEQERHAEVVGRMERQREVEKQLDTAAGRLKGAAATKQLVNIKKGGSNNVVGHFVRELLEDNANLQLGIAELREMLMNSNDEIQALREQLNYHQPVEEDVSATPTLKAELDPQQSESTASHRLSQELHIHHHYHVTPKQEVRKPKKKRLGLTPGVFTPPVLSNYSTPTTGGQWRLGHSPTAPPLLSSSDKDNNFAGFSNPPSEFASSVPSSPQSTRHNSMFDTAFPDVNPPTSPITAFDPMSPTWAVSHRKRPSESSNRSLQALSYVDVPDTPPSGAYPPQHHGIDGTIHEEDEDGKPLDDAPSLANGTSTESTEDSALEDSEYSVDDFMPRPRLRRAVSHESIMSLSGGLDIHTLKVRPSQMTLRPLGVSEAVITGITARPTLARGSTKRSDAALRDNFFGLPTPRAASGSQARLDSSPANSSGGTWRWGNWRPWGGGGMSRGSSPIPMARSTRAATSSPKSVEHDSAKDLMFRSPGINQAGSIPGFQAYWASQKRKGAPAKLTPDSIDREALIEGLAE